MTTDQDNIPVRVLICNCEGTMPLDGKALGAVLDKVFDCGALPVASRLCRSQLGYFSDACKAGGTLLVACTQEAPLFLETAEEIEDAAELRFVNIRERAAWSDQAKQTTPKIAALLAEAALDIPATRGVGLGSEGRLLVLGSDEMAISAAKQVADNLDVTVLLTGGSDVMPPDLMDVPVFSGVIKSATGYLGAFDVVVEKFAAASPSSRSKLLFETATPISKTRWDLILDLRGGEPLISAPDKCDGYFNPDPGNPALVQSALLELCDLVGEFEKPQYVEFEKILCAHGRSGVTGCSRCLDACSTGAITPDGDHVSVNPYICAGCGSCASVCPTGAITYALPANNAIYQRLGTVLGTYAVAGGGDAVLLVYGAADSQDIIGTMARHGRGLPANVIPFAVNEAMQIGLDFLLTAVAYGSGRLAVHVTPSNRGEAGGLMSQIELANSILGGLGYGDDRVMMIEDGDPDAVQSVLYGLNSAPPLARATFLAMGRKRSIMSLALKHLHANAPAPVDAMDLPDGAPFGAVEIDVAGCTLCLSCVGACPVGALKDNPDKPQLSFIEQACVQCGLCRNTCPEKVITLLPRLVFAGGGSRVLKEEEPFRCIRCDKPFAARASIDKMVEKLSGHPMFSDEGAIDRLKMCDDCRVIDMMSDDDQPMAAGRRPIPRTTDDYIKERDVEEKKAASRKDESNGGH